MINKGIGGIVIIGVLGLLAWQMLKPKEITAQDRIIKAVQDDSFSATATNLATLKKMAGNNVDSPEYQMVLNIDYNRAAEAARSIPGAMVVWSPTTGYYTSTEGGFAPTSLSEQTW